MELRPMGILLWVCAIPLATAPAFAEQGRYEYCKEVARDISGYRGPIPAEYKESTSVLEGAAKGAASGAAAGWITGKDAGKAAKRGAALGALIAGIKKGVEDEKRRENEAKRRIYRRELQACMEEGRD
ncbi:MAG: hypothetical protein AAGA68_25850 [Pseudomonadota bacterium]